MQWFNGTDWTIGSIYFLSWCTKRLICETRLHLLEEVLMDKGEVSLYGWWKSEGQHVVPLRPCLQCSGPVESLILSLDRTEHCQHLEWCRITTCSVSLPSSVDRPCWCVGSQSEPEAWTEPPDTEDSRRRTWTRTPPEAGDTPPEKTQTLSHCSAAAGRQAGEDRQEDMQEETHYCLHQTLFNRFEIDSTEPEKTTTSNEPSS